MTAIFYQSDIGVIMDNLIISKSDKPIKPCKKCGGTNRSKDGRCIPCREKWSECWNELNKDKRLEYKKMYRETHKEEIRQYSVTYHLEHKEMRSKKARIYYEENAEKMREYSRIYYLENPEKAQEACKKWASENKDQLKIGSQNRRARKLNSGGKLSLDLYDKLMMLQRGKCAICHKDLNKLKRKKIHLDHIMPLALGGSNTDDNIQLLCQPCNNKKHAKDPIEYMQSLGKLL